MVQLDQKDGYRPMKRLPQLAVAALATAPSAWAATTPIDLDPMYQPNFQVVVPSAYTDEMLIGAPATLMSTAALAIPNLFLRDGATGRVEILMDPTPQVVNSFYSIDSTFGNVVASRYFERVAFTIRTLNVMSGERGTAVWLKDRVNGGLQVVTRGPNGDLAQPINFESRADSFDATGRFLTFTSTASSLVAGDTNNARDVFLYDAQMGSLMRLSLTSTGTEAAQGGQSSAISPDASHVAFVSASALVPEDANASPDFYLLERASGTLRLISRGPQGEPATGVEEGGVWSEDGRYFAFRFLGTQAFKVDGKPAQSVIYDRSTGQLRSVRAFIGDALDVSVDPSSSAVVRQISSRYVLLTSRLLLPPPYGKSLSQGTYLSDLQTQELVRVDALETGELPADMTQSATLNGSQVLFQNAAPEFGTTSATLMHKWQASPPSNLRVSVEGPVSTFTSGTNPRYTVRITNDGAETVNDLVVRRYVQQGLVGNNEGSTCSYSCAYPALAPGASTTFSFEVVPQPSDTDATPRVQFNVRAQSLSRFDQTPADNKVTVNAGPAGSSGGGTGEKSGGGGALGELTLMLLAVAAWRRGSARKVRDQPAGVLPR